MNKGNVVQIIGPVIDVRFKEGEEPVLFNALEVHADGRTFLAEVAYHVAPGVIRAVSLETTDGLKRGDEVMDTEAPLSVPVGPEVLGNVFNVFGDSLNHKDQEFKKRWPIHRKAPPFTEQSTKKQVFETGIKVIDLLAPFIKGGKVGL